MIFLIALNGQGWMTNMENLTLSTNVISTIFYSTVALISIVMYNNANHTYDTNRSKIHSFKSFLYIYKIIQVTTLFICITSIWSDHPLLFKLFNNTDFFKYIGISLSGLGISLFALSRFSLGSNYSPCYDSYIPKTVNTSGIYSLVRHPIYSSNLLLMLGIFISCGSLIIAVNGIILFIYYVISAFIEERAILIKFPDYIKYKSKTGMFIPSIIKGMIQ